MTDLSKDLAVLQVITLMDSYSFDTDQESIEKLISRWLGKYNIRLIYLAVIEALYLGRYKSVSIEQILYSWSRQQKVNVHFGGDFERLISRKLPRHLNELNDELSAIAQPTEQITRNSNSTANNDKNNPNVPKTISQPIISTQVTPLPQKKIVAPSPTKNESIDMPSDSQRIVTFKPTPDVSDFFQKLKALAYNQRSSMDK